MTSHIAKQVSSFGSVEERGIANKLLTLKAVSSLVEKSDFNVLCWAPTNCSSENIVGNRGHLSLIFASVKHMDWKPFTIELVLRNDKISLYSYIFDEVSKYGLSGRREVMPSNNDNCIKFNFKVNNKSVDDLEFLALGCIKQWRWYSLLVFNCRDFVYRLALHLQKDSKRFGYLLPYIPVLYDDWFVKLMRASLWALVFKITHYKVQKGLGHVLTGMRLDFLRSPIFRLHSMIRYILLGQMCWNLAVGSLQLMHQKHEFQINASSLSNEEGGNESDNTQKVDTIYLSFCFGSVCIGSYFAVKYSRNVIHLFKGKRKA